MLRALFELPGVIADYTVGTLIVLVQLALTRRDARSLELSARANR